VIPDPIVQTMPDGSAVILDDGLLDRTSPSAANHAIRDRWVAANRSATEATRLAQRARAAIDELRAEGAPIVRLLAASTDAGDREATARRCRVAARFAAKRYARLLAGVAQ